MSCKRSRASVQWFARTAGLGPGWPEITLVDNALSRGGSLAGRAGWKYILAGWRLSPRGVGSPLSAGEGPWFKRTTVSINSTICNSRKQQNNLSQSERVHYFSWENDDWWIITSAGDSPYRAKQTSTRRCSIVLIWLRGENGHYWANDIKPNHKEPWGKGFDFFCKFLKKNWSAQKILGFESFFYSPSPTQWPCCCLVVCPRLW